MVMNMDAPDTTNHTDRWVEDRLRALDPPDTWEPATAIALAHFRERAAAAAATAPRRRFRWFTRPQPRSSSSEMSYAEGEISFCAWPPAFLGFEQQRRRRVVWPWVAAASAVCLVLLTPATRTAAQRLWDTFFAERVEFVTLDIDKLPRSFTDQHIRQIGPLDLQVGSLGEAAEHARFTPRLPDASVVGDGEPALSVTGAISLEWRINNADLEAAARDAGLANLHFPPGWDGSHIGVHSSPIVTANYLRFQLIQVMPLAIITPTTFDLALFTQNILRIGGLSPSAARAFSTQMAAAPFALVAISPEEKVTMKQVQLRSGQGTLVHDLDDDGNLQRTTLVWSTADRLYAISAALSDDEVIGIANAIPIP
jgi:hypothetical protein